MMLVNWKQGRYITTDIQHVPWSDEIKELEKFLCFIERVSW
jgi:hypothetical protein